ncbi:SDR family NAD(P)-dependent oxidoreductase [Sphingobium estronivorans]|uniref:SDR family NAD(P)-dependent oxidoreductase n=1 Tax=Sphingobium estronivorans TaxID=1577690 RepID=UPI001239EE18|nr:SDR family NAD(P)-dependent oxidoreductase [Sphingobium estronivorans]
MTTRIALDGMVALVTGGGGMIGGAIARRMAEGGAHVALADREAPTPAAQGRAYAADLSDAAQLRALVDRVLADFGRIDCLVTAAGITSTGAFENITAEEWDRVHAINLRGVFLANQAVIAPMKAAGFGRIVNIGSVLAKNGGNPRPWLDAGEQARAGNAAYGAAKAGVHAMTLYLAKELAVHGITVNAVAPGPIASPMTTSFPAALVRQIPAGRMGNADEVAGMVAWLCSRENAFVTGEIIDVNGGLWMD